MQKKFKDIAFLCRFIYKNDAFQIYARYIK